MIDKITKVMSLMSLFAKKSNGDMEQDTHHDHLEKASGHGNPHLETGNWFNDGMNRLNRLPRPLAIAGTFYILIWPMYEPDDFIKWTTALSTVPENLWMLIFIIFGSFLSTKAVRDFKSRTNFSSYTSETSGYNGRFSNINEGDDRLLDEPPMNANAMNSKYDDITEK